MSEANPTVQKHGPKALGLAEFSALMAFLISMVAMSIDIMLPVIDVVGAELGASGKNSSQMIILFLFVGLAFGQLIYGPVSDTTGRKPAILTGLVIFFIGTVLAIVAKDFNAMLAGRFLQGLGAAAPRIVSMAVVRDLYSGRAMAQVTSVIMGFFIIVPALAPAIGQGILMVAEWRMIFYVLLGQAVLCALWFGLRQPETLHPEYRRPLSLLNILKGAWEVLTIRISFWYTIAAGIIFGAFVGYLISSPQIFEDLFGITDTFPFYFGALAISIGAASLFNVRLVVRLGMRRLCVTALSFQAIISLIFFGIAMLNGGMLSLPLFMIWAASAFFLMGFLFGNFNAIAMEPLGHIAGVGSAMVGGMSTFISLGIGGMIGNAYNGTVIPIIGGFALLGVLAILVMKWADRER
ncbi:MAG: Bcr/CflA family drug resistance efflux transporter [Robiginitomaculum sp.]|nr:MAG: Bcr/CflA family drug resistance efflux transporter [Robiginitomaculum sp.]